ncbi:glucose-1-phosphate adenylyltransferase [Bacillus sp. AFS076308]|uniref:glucose-1-phosphate adenylyltransferase n=1 Tax=unclassified Bacillus (in: firmicutes) TaxID=185979 RepID=UPI000BFAA9FA|nr:MULTISPECIES: glucose-1-phosphate adenylyltransferase [unclassified Bacillus (in: firmicutes)]PFO07394.1 glucose-1-phosphate adenylyltransferase [Bacillus sp. AFS076308]PGV52021.1 glucose-1-phosphate adenylyltransferase [Bacillus sp. AFS037270]
MTAKQCIAMLLAGGRGSRLKELTQYIAKPAVPFGGKYRIIDFTLSNCRNSGIDTVGVLTQYQPHTLQNYIGDGKHWDLNRKNGGVTILPPYQCEQGERWYEGTAHAVYQNLRYIESYNPEYVLIISGDHIYKMDYSKMLEQHIQTKADATISVIHVPWKEANRFGIMSVDSESNRIAEFEEKPKQPKSNLASMGIYIFNWKLLKKYLETQEKNPYSSKDFGKDIIPAMIENNQQLYAYQFKGYWKDVGTIQSLWEANMDLLSYQTNPLLQNEEWEIYTYETSWTPLYLDGKASIHQSLVSDGCKVFGTVQNSVLFHGVTVGKGAVIRDSVILPNTVIGQNAIINRTVVGSGTVIESNVQMGEANPFSEITLIGDNHLIIGDKSKKIKNHIV